MNYVIIDGNLIVHKSKHVHSKLSIEVKDRRVKTGIAYGVVKNIVRMNSIYQPCRTVIVFDPKNREVVSKRVALFPEYKAGRELDPEISKGFNMLYEFLSSMNITVVHSSPKWEADDMVARVVYLCKIACSGDENNIIIVSEDKDFFQLLDDDEDYTVQMHCRFGKVINRKTIIRRFGFRPKNHIDYLALVGDKVDNIPGVKGIGPKTATDIIVNDKYDKLSKEEWRVYIRNRELVRLHKGETVVGNIEHFRYNEKNLNKVIKKYKMVSFLRKPEQRTFKSMKPMSFIR